MDEKRTPTLRAWLTVEEAMRAAGVSRNTIYAWVRQGRLRLLPSDDRMHRIAGDDLARLLAERRAAATTGVRVATLRHWAEEANARDG